LSYPGMWEFSDSPGYGLIYLFLSKQEGPEDLFRENVNITKEDISQYDIGLPEYVEAATGQIVQALDDVKIVSSKTMKNKNWDYQEVCYTGIQGDFKLKGLQYYVVTKDLAYVLTYTAEVEKFDKYLETAKKIMDSLEIK